MLICILATVPVKTFTNERSFTTLGRFKNFEIQLFKWFGLVNMLGILVPTVNDVTNKITETPCQLLFHLIL